MRSATHAAALLALSVLASGCSFAFMTRPPEVVAAPNYPIDCTSSRAAPVLDTICAGYFVVNTVYLGAAKDCAQAINGETCFSADTKRGGMILSAGLAVLCAVAAGTGYSAASRCEAMKDLNALCITGDQAACLQLKPGWGGAAAVSSPFPGAPPPPPPGACAKDTDCKGDRVCTAGVCVEPRR